MTEIKEFAEEIESKLANAKREIGSLYQAMLAGQLTFTLDGHNDL